MSMVKKMPKNEPCLLCSETKEPKLGNIFERPEVINMIHNVSGVSLTRDKSLPETVCCNCIMRINCCLEFQRSIIRTMLNHRIRYYFNIGDHEKVTKYQQECKTFQVNCMRLPTGVSETFFGDTSLGQLLLNGSDNLTTSDTIVNNGTDGIIISDVRTEDISQDPDSTGDEFDELESVGSVFTRTDTTNDSNTTAELLEPMFQTSESALDTESGGNIHVQNAARSAARKHKEYVSFQCKHCNKIYRKPHALRKHMRSHQSVEHRKSISEKLKFKCEVCHQEFESQNILRKHNIIHEPKIICKVCGESFRLQYDYSWHKTCCEAKHDSNSTTASQRRTRSQCRSRYSIDSSRTDTTYNARLEMVKIWAQGLEIGDRPDPKDLATSNVRDDDCVSMISDISGMTRLSEVESISTSSESSNSLSTQDESSTESSPWNHEQKRRKLHKAGKKRAKRKGKEYFACSFRHICGFGSTSFSKIMHHEVNKHNAMLLHGCHECNQWFTNKEYLIRHKKRHRPQFHICINCNCKFDNKYELEHHTLLHAEKSFNCNFCEMSFLKRAEVERHARSVHPNKNSKRKGIVERKAALKRPYISPLVKRLREFNGYKSKELIQDASTSNVSTKTVTPFSGCIVPRNEAEYKVNEMVRLYKTRLARQWDKYSAESSCSSKITERSSRSKTRKKLVRESTTTRYPNKNYKKTQVKKKGKKNGKNRKKKKGHIEPEYDSCSNLSSMFDGTESLSSYPSFYTSSESLNSIEPTEPIENSTPASLSKVPNSVDNIQSASNVNSGDGLPRHLNIPTIYSRANLGLQVNSQPSADTNRISLPIVLIEKYIPPYDILFDKYLAKDD